jgi:pimeloyl-ACP methyl ester carboxylesterase
MSTTKTGTLKVPGANLYYEVRGSGPLLLMIPGSPADAAIFGGIGGILSDRYTVVAFDLRGLSRSPLDGAPEDQPVEILADDAARVLEKFTSEPAYVLGCSGGALAGLDLVTRYPGKVRTLVAHEPPLMEMLPNGPEWREFFQELYETYRSQGAGVAMGQFIAGVQGYIGPGADPSAPPAEFTPPEMPDPSQMPPEALEMMGRMQGNLEFFFSHQIRTATRYVPDIDTLKDSPTKIVVAIGDGSKGQPAYNAASLLAERLETTPASFPGDHQGFATHTDAFAEAVEKALRD